MPRVTRCAVGQPLRWEGERSLATLLGLAKGRAIASYLESCACLVTQGPFDVVRAAGYREVGS